MARYPREKLIRNLRRGDMIRVTDATKVPEVSYRVRVTHVQEGRLSMFGKRTWQAFFQPHIMFGTWTHITGETSDKIMVYGNEVDS